MEENPLLIGLNDSQRQAVLSTEGRVLMLCGPGAGKTKTLTHRIAYLLQQGVEPWQILAITFTNKAAREMKERIYSMNPMANNCWIGTFHSICNRILYTNIHALGLTEYTLIDDSDQSATIKQALKLLAMEMDKDVIRKIKSQISTWKSEGINPGQAQSMTFGDSDGMISANVYEKYEEIKLIHSYFDYDDILLKTVQLFEAHPEIMGKYQNQFRYVAVDETQDTNAIQFKLIEMLSSRYGNVFLIGDESQSVYSFRAAKIEYIMNYKRMYPEAMVIMATENYRSTHAIVNTFNHAIKNNRTRIDRDNMSMSEVGDNVQLTSLADVSRESDYVCGVIAQAKRMYDLDWKDCAVLYRMNSQAKNIEMTLRDLGIPYKIVGAISFHDRKEIKDLVQYMRLIYNLADDYAVERVINVPKRGIGEATMNKIRSFAEERRIPLFTAIMNIDEVAEQNKIGAAPIKKIKAFQAIIEKLHTEAAQTENFSAARLLKSIIKETDFMSQFDIEKEEDEARIDNIQFLRDHARMWDSKEKEFNCLATFVSEISLDGEEEDDEENFVTLSSVHGVKGLEFPLVCVIGMEEDTFPHFRARHSQADLEEERRLFYVAVSRAKKYLVLTNARQKFNWGAKKGTATKPSQFLSELLPGYLDSYRRKNYRLEVK